MFWLCEREETRPIFPVGGALFPCSSCAAEICSAGASNQPQRSRSIAMSLTRLFRRKSLDHLMGETTGTEQQLKRTLGPLQLTMLGFGAIGGAALFSTVGTAAPGGGDHCEAAQYWR